MAETMLVDQSNMLYLPREYELVSPSRWLTSVILWKHFFKFDSLLQKLPLCGSLLSPQKRRPWQNVGPCSCYSYINDASAALTTARETSSYRQVVQTSVLIERAQFELFSLQLFRGQQKRDGVRVPRNVQKQSCL